MRIFKSKTIYVYQEEIEEEEEEEEKEEKEEKKKKKKPLLEPCPLVT
jgi:hypothetical protein